MPDNFLSSYTFLLPLVLLIAILLYVWVKKAKASFSRVLLYLNVLLLVLLAWDTAIILFNPKNNKADLGDKQKRLLKNYKPCSTCVKPDIYYFIFDAYTSSATLRSEFSFENPLDNYLLEKGFYIIPHSKSNYNLTPFSLGSVFNLDYLPGLKSDHDFFIKQYLPGISSVYHSELFPILEREGYTTINHSIFDIRNVPSSIRPFDLWEIHQIYARHNLFWKIDNDIGWLIRKKLKIRSPRISQQAYVDARDHQLMQILKNVIATISHPESKPRFVYTHFMLPHGPYTFDSLGNRHPPLALPLSDEQYRTGYIDQVKYSNKIIKELVELIFQNNKRPFVIIIQGDHGFRFLKPEKHQLQFNNLNAFYFSNGNYKSLQDSMTSVNTFRVVLNNYFDKNFPLLRDSMIFLKY